MQSFNKKKINTITNSKVAKQTKELKAIVQNRTNFHGDKNTQFGASLPLLTRTPIQ